MSNQYETQLEELKREYAMADTVSRDEIMKRMLEVGTKVALEKRNEYLEKIAVEITGLDGSLEEIEEAENINDNDALAYLISNVRDKLQEADTEMDKVLTAIKSESKS